VANISITGLIWIQIARKRLNLYKSSSRVVRFAPPSLPMILIRFLELYGRTAHLKDRSMQKRRAKN
jgi:hypothetical protein